MLKLFRFASRLSGAGTVMLLAVASAAATAGDTPYAAPERQFTDINGVDLGTSHFVKSVTLLTIGDPTNGGLAWGPSTTYRSDNYSGSIQYWGNNIGGTFHQDYTKIKIDGIAAQYQGDCAIRCHPMTDNPTTFSYKSGYWIYTIADGTVYKFDAINTPDDTQPANSVVQFIGKLLSITKPNGVTTNIYYDVQAGCTKSNCYRVRSVVSNVGFALKYDYSAPDDYGLPKKIWAVNTLAHTCDATVTSCDNYDNYVSINGDVRTDSMGNATEQHIVAGNRGPAGYQEFVTNYKSPTGNFVDAAYDAYGRVLSLTNPTGTWTYSYSDNSLSLYQTRTNRTITVKDPAGNVFLQANVYKAFGDVIFTQDALDRVTNIRYIDAISDVYERISGKTYPEGNFVNYNFDSRANVTSVTTTPKANSGLAAVTIYAGYDSTCSNPKTCNKPNWTKDAKGNQTDYTYDATSGEVATVTLPADNNGLRRRTYNTYPPFDTGNGVIYRLTRTETCALNSSQLQLLACPATTDTQVTVIDYGTSTTAPKTYKSLQPYSVTKTDGAGSLSITTNYTYDNVGNVTVVDGPRTDVDDRVYKTYDANRHVIFEIGVWPGGNGSPKRTVTRHWYDGDGKEWKTEIGYANTNATDGSDFVVTAFTRVTFDVAGRAIKTEQVQP